MKDTHYLSQTALEELKEELTHRKTIVRKEIADQIGSAKELGDLSENFEYHDAKERQGQNESRILELENMIHNSVVVNSRSGESTINLGSQFVVEVSGKEKTFEIVGATESDPLNGKISNESPLGNAFLGLSVGDVTDIETAQGITQYKVLSIR